ncbi:MAG: MoxR family ATPase [Armatimonadetes bacterium]|nr:MoxR family ATPase [Armatimonadota bacterium]
MSIEQRAEEFRETFSALREEIGRVVVGQTETIDGALSCLATGGHALLEGAPGLGKTLLVRSLAEAVSCSFSRIQFTPDLMPADVTGTNIVADTPAGREFRFQPGPVFGNIILADEINRATPKTQSALLEAMQEQAVTVGGERRPLPSPFLVLATQNPIEMEGTYPLPEAQLDRFMLKLLVPFPTQAQMGAILERTTTGEEPAVKPVVTGERIVQMQETVREIALADHVRDYLLRIVMATHPESELAPAEVRHYVRYGASPRGAQALALSAKVRALLDGRFNVATQDVEESSAQALRHRLILNFEAEAEQISADMIVEMAVRAAQPDEKLPV